jgi:superfamily II DNA helicase RecQ
MNAHHSTHFKGREVRRSNDSYTVCMYDDRHRNVCTLQGFVVAVNHDVAAAAAAFATFGIARMKPEKQQTIRIHHDALNAVSDLPTCCGSSLYYQVAAVMQMVS